MRRANACLSFCLLKVGAPYVWLCARLSSPMMPVNHNAAGAVTLTSPWSDWLPLDCWRILRASSY